MRQKAYIPALLLLFFVVAAPAALLGEEKSAGTIESAVGTVTVERADGTVLKAADGLTLFPGDRVETGEDGRAWIVLAEKGRLVLHEDSHLSIDDIPSQEVEESYSVIRLALGRLFCKLEKLLRKGGGIELHTPTAVVGVRGTEFDTVVARDITSAVSVDEGAVQVEANGAKLVVKEGTMTEVEMGVPPAARARPIPKKKMDWKAWRRERFKNLHKRLPKIAPRLRERFEKASERALSVSEEVKKSQERVMWSIKALRGARRSENPSNRSQAGYRLKMAVDLYKSAIMRFRRAASRVKVIHRASRRLMRFTRKKKEKFTPEDHEAIVGHLKAVHQRGKQVKQELKKTIRGIRRTFFELRKLKRERKRRMG